MKKVIFMILFYFLFFCLSSCNNNMNEKQENKIIEEKTSEIVEYMVPYFGYDLNYGAMPVFLKDYSDKYSYDLLSYNGYVTTSEIGTLHENLTDITNAQWVGWNPGYNDIENEVYFDKAYFVIVQKELDNIVGYVIIRLIQDDDVYFAYYSEIVKSVFFPKIDEKFQDVTLDYIKETVEEVLDEKK